MKPLAFMAPDGTLHLNKQDAGPHAIPLIPMPIPLTNNRIISAARRINRKCKLTESEIALIRAVEREHGIICPEDC